MDILTNVKAALSTVNVKLTELKEALAKEEQAVQLINSEIDKLYALPISLDDWGLYFKAQIKKNC